MLLTVLLGKCLSWSVRLSRRLQLAFALLENSGIIKKSF